ncbi:hypothetical protein AD428_23420 [Achromobacter sp. DMS1]|nr:hypothetical protein AD428_23420 [Achromobacter sp. DMS1]
MCPPRSAVTASPPPSKATKRIFLSVQASGLQAYVQTGPGGMGYVVRSQVAKDPATLSTATALLRELGFKSTVVSSL